MSHKSPLLFRPAETLKLVATPRMARWLAVVVLAVLIPSGAETLLRPRMAPAARGPVPLPVPIQEWTMEAAAWPVVEVLFGTIPPPGPNQKHAGKCNPKASQVELNGGCWVKTDHPKPCPEGFQWENEEDGKCYLPVAEAKPLPRAGEPAVVNIAGQE